MRKVSGLAAIVISIATLAGCSPAYQVKKQEPVVISQNQEPEPIGYRLKPRWGLSLDIEPIYTKKRNR